MYEPLYVLHFENDEIEQYYKDSKNAIFDFEDWLRNQPSLDLWMESKGYGQYEDEDWEDIKNQFVSDMAQDFEETWSFGEDEAEVWLESAKYSD